MFKTFRTAGVTAAALFMCANASQASAQTAATTSPAAATVSPSVHAAAPAQVGNATTNVTAAATNAAIPAVAIVHAGLAERVVAIDENTSLIIGDGGLEVAGDGSVWTADRDGDRVSIGVLAA